MLIANLAIAVIIVFYIVYFGIIWITSGWLHLSFQCSVCKLEYSKALHFILGHSFFKCPFCHRHYIIRKIGKKCRFRRNPLDRKGLPIIFPFEVEWEKPFSSA